MTKKHAAEFAMDINRKILKHDVVLAYAGDMDMKAVNTLIGKINEKIKKLDVDFATRQKVYHVTVECLENLYHHNEGNALTDSHEDSFAVFSLMKEDDNYFLTTGNYIKNEDIPKLKEMIDKVNLMGKDERKQLYRDILCDRVFSEKGGAGLGMVEIAIRSSGELNYEFKPVDSDRSFYIFQTKIFN